MGGWRSLTSFVFAAQLACGAHITRIAHATQRRRGGEDLRVVRVSGGVGADGNVQRGGKEWRFEMEGGKRKPVG
jgi:hypothetical protein